MTTILTDDEKRALACIAVNSYLDDRIPQWITDLATLSTPDGPSIDRLMYDGLVHWRNGWRVTAAGWRALTVNRVGVLTWR